MQAVHWNLLVSLHHYLAQISASLRSAEATLHGLFWFHYVPLLTFQILEANQKDLWVGSAVQWVERRLQPYLLMPAPISSHSSMHICLIKNS